MKRREFLQTLGIAGASVLPFRTASADPSPDTRELSGVLVDTTRCAGCRGCEYACAEVNGLPEPELSDEEAFASPRTPSPTQWTVVNRYETEAGEVFRKQQCMHCDQPACASACLTRAMLKTPDGPVVWRDAKCMGCRYCMVSCPFDMPRFEYDSANPRISKCRMCAERLKTGQVPACVDNCPAEALTFGRKSELFDIARRRIYERPDDYVHAIYGEHEVGGTGWLYLAGVPFAQLGLRTDLGTTAYPEYTRDFLYGVPVILTLWPAMLLGLSQATKGKQQNEQDAHDDTRDH